MNFNLNITKEHLGNNIYNLSYDVSSNNMLNIQTKELTIEQIEDMQESLHCVINDLQRFINAKIKPNSLKPTSKWNIFKIIKNKIELKKEIKLLTKTK